MQPPQEENLSTWSWTHLSRLGPFLGSEIGWWTVEEKAGAGGGAPKSKRWDRGPLNLNDAGALWSGWEAAAAHSDSDETESVAEQ